MMQPGSLLVMLCEYQDNRLANLIYRPYGHFTYLRQRGLPNSLIQTDTTDTHLYTPIITDI
jgi:hypothetical protein